MNSGPLYMPLCMRSDIFSVFTTYSKLLCDNSDSNVILSRMNTIHLDLLFDMKPKSKPYNDFNLVLTVWGEIDTAHRLIIC